MRESGRAERIVRTGTQYLHGHIIFGIALDTHIRLSFITGDRSALAEVIDDNQ